MDILIAAILTIITAATPLLFAALGELVTEKSGVLNLGVEGMMIMGAIIGFVTVHHTGSASVAILASMVAGAVYSLGTCFYPLRLIMVCSCIIILMYNQLCPPFFSVGLCSFLLLKVFDKLSAPPSWSTEHSARGRKW